MVSYALVFSGAGGDSTPKSRARDMGEGSGTKGKKKRGGKKEKREEREGERERRENRVQPHASPKHVVVYGHMNGHAATV